MSFQMFIQISFRRESFLADAATDGVPIDVISENKRTEKNQIFKNEAELVLLLNELDNWSLDIAKE